MRTSGWVLREVFCESTRVVLPLLSEEGIQGAGAVNALFEDREGNLWVGGATGLERIRDSTFITYSTDKGLPSNASGPVYVDGEDRAWFAPEKGGLYWIKDGRVQPVKPELFEKDAIYSIAGRDHEIWIGRRQGGLTRLRVRWRNHHNRNLRPGKWAGAKQCVRHLPGSRRSGLGGYPEQRHQQD